jgi:cytochrome P450
MAEIHQGKVLFPLLTSLPDSLLDSAARSLAQRERYYKAQSKEDVKRGASDTDGGASTILETLVSASHIYRCQDAVECIYDELRNTIGAGTETTGAKLSILFFWVLSTRSIEQRLKEELKTITADLSGWLECKDLEKLPYLQACISEALRISSPVSGRLARVNQRADMSYTDRSGRVYSFPEGTVLSMSMRDLHFNPDVFPAPHTFDPNRWLRGNPEHLKAMQRALVPFSRGSRNCISQFLAKQELLLTAGNIMHKYNFQLYETSERDIALVHDWFAPYAGRDAEGVSVTIQKS